MALKGENIMAKIGRNDPCPCGSGKKYKKCCLRKDEERHISTFQSKVERVKIDKEDEELFEDEIPDIGTSDEEILSEDSDIVDEIKAPEIESLEQDRKRERKPRRQISDEVPEISEEEKVLVDAWWAKYKKLKGSDEIRKHLETFFSEHPKLVPNLELHHEVLFELGAQYLREGRPGEYIDLLLRVRRDFTEAFLKSFSYYDRDIISYKVITGHKNEVEDFLGYFKEYPDDDPDNLFPVIDFLMANNCQDIVTNLVRDIYYEVCTSPNIISGDDILDPLAHSYFIPFLKPDFSDQDMQSLAHQLSEIKIPLRDEYYQPDFLKEIFHFIFGNFTHWSIQDCRTDAQIYKRYYEITLNFMGFLKKNKDTDWMAAEFYRIMVYRYLSRVIPKGKRSKETFIFTKRKIDETIAKSYQTFFSLDTTKTLGTLKALYLFAEYLEVTESVTRERKESIQQWCTELFNQAYPHLSKEEIAARAFERFPA